MIEGYENAYEEFIKILKLIPSLFDWNINITKTYELES